MNRCQFLGLRAICSEGRFKEEQETLRERRRGKEGLVNGLESSEGAETGVGRGVAAGLRRRVRKKGVCWWAGF